MTLGACIPKMAGEICVKFGMWTHLGTCQLYSKNYVFCYAALLKIFAYYAQYFIPQFPFSTAKY